MSREDLEQELRIVEAEYDDLKKEHHGALQEISRLRGVIAEAGIEDPQTSLALAASNEERAELEAMRAGAERELEALDELRKPTGALIHSQDATESTLDIVRANQRERFELQERSAKANTILSRIAGLMNLDRWDEDGGEVLFGRLQRFALLRAKIAGKVKELRKRLEGATGEEKYQRGAIDTLEWVSAALKGNTPATRDPAQLRRLELVVSGNPIPMFCKPEWTVADIRSEALAIQYPHGAEPPLPVSQWLIYDESGTPIALDATIRDLVLPTERVVISLPAGTAG
jgi:hypothetical protein